MGAVPMGVAFRPPAAGLAGDRLFQTEDYRHVGPVPHWMEPMRTLARVGRSQGFEFHTDDVLKPHGARVLIFGEMPASRWEVTTIRQAYPHLKLVLQILETPIGRAWAFDPANHADFDAVVTYDRSLADGHRYFAFRIPAGGLGSQVPEGLPWAKRTTACMIANVPDVRPALPRRTGIGLMRRGWRFNARTWWEYVTESGSLYGERWRTARQFEDALGSEFAIFGPGWPAATRTKRGGGFTSARGAYLGSKLDLMQEYRFTLAYENCLNDRGYITEKLFDALLAGCVPIYLGNVRIDELVPAAVFVDARRFKSPKEMAAFIAGMSEAQWREMRAAGAAFIQQPAVPLFGSMQYVDSMLAAVRAVLPAGAPQAARHHAAG